MHSRTQRHPIFRWKKTRYRRRPAPGIALPHGKTNGRSCPAQRFETSRARLSVTPWHGLLLVQQKRRQSKRDTTYSDQHARDPVSAPLGEQRHRADHQAHLDEPLSSIKSVRSPADVVAFLLQFFGFLADVVFVAFIALYFFLVFLVQ